MCEIGAHCLTLGCLTVAPLSFGGTTKSCKGRRNGLMKALSNLINHHYIQNLYHCKLSLYIKMLSMWMPIFLLAWSFSHLLVSSWKKNRWRRLGTSWTVLLLQRPGLWGPLWEMKGTIPPLTLKPPHTPPLSFNEKLFACCLEHTSHWGKLFFSHPRQSTFKSLAI